MYQWAVECVLHHEGGLVDHENDPGGITNFGISLRFLETAGKLDGTGFAIGDVDRDGDVDADDIRKLTKTKAKEIYEEKFWKPNRCAEIRSALISTKVFDMAVNMGGRQAWRLVQRAVNELGGDLKIDGAVGPRTISAVNSYSGRDYELLDAIRKRQAGFYEMLIAKKPKLAVFRLGWRRRAAF